MHNTENSKKNSPWLIASLLVLVFAVPIFTAHVLFHCRDRISIRTVEKGILLTPPLSTKSFAFFDRTYLGKWQLVYIEKEKENIDENTKTSILTRIHEATGKDKKRVMIRTITTKELPINLQDQFAIIDPQGWLIMHYSADANPQGILKDMKQLLRVSHGG